LYPSFRAEDYRTAMLFDSPEDSRAYGCHLPWVGDLYECLSYLKNAFCYWVFFIGVFLDGYSYIV
jgi:hypothetical protein